MYKRLTLSSVQKRILPMFSYPYFYLFIYLFIYFCENNFILNQQQSLQALILRASTFCVSSNSDRGFDEKKDSQPDCFLTMGKVAAKIPKTAQTNPCQRPAI